MLRLTRWLPALAAGAALAGSVAQAGLLPVSVSVIPESDKFRWTYAIVLPTDSQLQTGNYFTIYDFRGLVADSATAPAGWEFTTANVGPTPDLVSPTDDPNVPNLSFRYVGDTISAGQIGLGNFMAVSEFSDRAESFFTATTNRTSDGLVDTNITTTSVPVPGGGGVTVPEPTTLALAALGLPLAAFGRRLRKN